MVLNKNGKYNNKNYHFNKKNALEVIKSILPYNAIPVPEDRFYENMQLLGYSDQDKANLVALTTILTPQVVGEELFSRLSDNLPSANAIHTPEAYKALPVRNMGFILNQQKNSYDLLVDKIFGQDTEKKHDWKGDFRNVFNPDSTKNIKLLTDFPGIRQKTANLMVLNISYYELFTEEFKVLNSNFKDIRLPVDLHTCQISMRTGLVSSDTNSFHGDMLRDYLRNNLDLTIREMRSTLDYCMISKGRLTNMIHRAFYNLGSLTCSPKKCDCSIVDKCTFVYRLDHKISKYHVDSKKQMKFF